jgi:uncharacterized protein (DUF1778 family)
MPFSDRDRDRFLHHLDNPPAVDSALRLAFAKNDKHHG